MNYCYVIYSPGIDRFYIGETENFPERLEQHNSGYYKGSFTSKASDWQKYLLLECETRAKARRLEAFIKKQKSSAFIRKIKNSKAVLKDVLSKI